jgi:hypothetical protein
MEGIELEMKDAVSVIFLKSWIELNQCSLHKTLFLHCCGTLSVTLILPKSAPALLPPPQPLLEASHFGLYFIPVKCSQELSDIWPYIFTG